MRFIDDRDAMIQELQGRNMALELENHRLQEQLKMSRRDGLTGLLTRSTFDIEYLCQRRKDAVDDVTVAFIDVDNFKRVNDDFGHEEGDLLLVTLARIVQMRVRETDYVVRWGGDEILVVLPGATLSDAETVIRDISCSFDHYARRFNECDLQAPRVGLSIGIVSGNSVVESVIMADKEMYTMKRAHRVKGR